MPEAPIDISRRSGQRQSRTAAKLVKDVSLVVTTGPGAERSGESDALALESSNGYPTSTWLAISCVAGEQPPADASLVELPELVRRHLAPLSARARNRLVDFLASAPQLAAGAPSVELSDQLFALRQALRERLPLHENHPNEQRGIAVEQILAVDDTAFYVQGWARDDEAPITRLTAVSPEGARVDLHQQLVRYQRHDVDAFFGRATPGSARDGFGCHFELPAPSLRRAGWLLEMESSNGSALEVACPRTVTEASAARSVLLDETMRDGAPNDELMERHVVPMMSRIQSRPEAAGAIDHVLQYGDAPDAPEVSVVVPVYTHIQHLEAQLAEFADDPALRAADLVYVLDSPEQAEAMRHLASNLFPVYQLPFRVVVLERNSGFAGANNAGASVARGRLLLLLNSDVLPDRPGWLETMSRFYDATPDIGALAPKLIYEDDSIQHAGMYLYQPPGSSLWIDAHYWKGLHRSFEAANVTRPVPAVSGACMMIDRALYEELGGLSGHYVRGDYEDFDICLRLLERGRQSWYLSEVELYHLEGQSYSTDLRLPANSFNAWLHTHTWRATIEELMSGEMGRADWSG